MNARFDYTVSGFLTLACFVMMTSSSHGTMVSFQNGVDGYTGQDTARLLDNNFTAVGTTFIVGDSGNDADNRSLLRFDLSSLAGEEVVGNGTLSLTIISTLGGPSGDDFFDVYVIFDTNAGWQDASAPDGPRWNFHGNPAGRRWKDSGGTDLAIATSNVEVPTLGGLGTPGQGYALTPIDSINQTSYTPGDVIAVTIPESVLQNWIDGTNAGLLFRKRDENGSVNPGRLEFYNVAAPLLELEFAVVSEPSTGGLGLLALVASAAIAFRHWKKQGIKVVR